MGEEENEAAKPAPQEASARKKRKKARATDATGGGTPRGQRIFQIVALALAVAFVVVGLRYRSKKKTQVDPINAPDDDGPRAKCARGDGPSCMTIGEAYEKGEGVPVDLAEARAFFQKACMAHHKPGCERRDALRPQASSTSSGRKPIYRPE